MLLVLVLLMLISMTGFIDHIVGVVNDYVDVDDRFH